MSDRSAPTVVLDGVVYLVVDPEVHADLAAKDTKIKNLQDALARAHAEIANRAHSEEQYRKQLERYARFSESGISLGDSIDAALYISELEMKINALQFPGALSAIEDTISWAAQQGYVGAGEAARELGKRTGREMFCSQPYYNAYAWKDKKETDTNAK